MSALKKNFLFQFLLASSQILFPLITYPYLSRVLGPSGIGKVGYVDFVSTFIISIFSFGIPLYGAREISKSRNDSFKRSKITSELLLLHFLFTIAGLAIFLLLLLLNPNFRDEKQLMLLGSLYIVFQAAALEWYLQGMEAFQFIAFRNILTRLAGILAIFLFVKSSSDYLIYYLIIVVTQLLVSVSAIFHLTKETRLFFDTSFKSHLRPLFFFFLTSSFISIYVFFDTIILGWLSGKQHVGYYTFALRIVKLPLALLLTLNTILYPRISFLHAQGNQDKISSLTYFTIKFIFTATIPVCICFYVLAPEIIHLLGGAQFNPSITVLQVLSPLPLLIGFSNFFVLQILAPSHKEKLIMIAVSVASVVSVIVNFLLIPRLQEYGAAIAALCAEMAVFLVLFNFSFPQVRKHFSWSLLTAPVLSFLALPVVWISRSILFSDLYVLLASLVIFGFLYCFLQYYFFNNEVVRIVVDSISTLFANNKKKIADAKGV